MAHPIIITAGSVIAEAELNDSLTAQVIREALPITGQAKTWGDEIYFKIPIQMEEAPDARADVEVGELGYWPMGEAFCIFFGPTPASTGAAPRAASPVNIVGRVPSDAASLTSFRQVEAGATVTLESAATR